MNENNKHPSAGRGRKRAGWFRRLFFGGSKTLADDMLETDRYGQQKIEDVEVILSPGKQIVKGFLEKKYAVVALVVVVVMFLIAFVGPLFMPKYFDAYSENTQQSIYPTLSMMKMPKELQKDVKQVSSYGPFTVGLSGSGKVYVWGCTQIGTTGFDVSRIPEDVQKANIVMVAAGIDHIIAIDDKGKIYGWGNYKLGQYGRYAEFADTSFVLPIPQELYDNGVDVSKVKKLTCGYQSTAILMEDGTLYVWGNKNAYSNMEFFATLNEVDETLDFVPEQTLLKDIAFTMNYIIGVRMPPAGGGLYEPLVFGPAVLESFEQPSTDFTSVGAKIKSTLREHGQNGKDATIERVFATATTVAYQLSDNAVLFGGAFQNQERSYVAPPKLAEGEYFVELTTGIHHYTGLTNLGNVYAFGENLLDQCDTPKNLSKAAHVFACGFQTYTTDENNQLLQKWGHKGYLFGTDKNGADIFQRIVNGSKMTMTIGGVAVLISTFIGIIVGCVAGYFGGKVDNVMMRIVDIIIALPSLLYTILLMMLMGSNVRSILIALCLSSWVGTARITRSQVVSLKHQEYALAAKLAGASDFQILLRHLLPNAMGPIIVSVMFLIPGAIFSEAFLSFLGIGIQKPMASWGSLANDAIGTLTSAPYQMFFPIAAISLTMFSLNFIGDGLRDALDPKLKK